MVETSLFVIPFVAAFVSAICAGVTSWDSDNIFWKISISVWSGCNFLDIIVFGLKISARIFLVCIGMIVFIPVFVFIVTCLYNAFRFIPHAKSIADCYRVNNARSIIYNANGKVELYNDVIRAFTKRVNIERAGIAKGVDRSHLEAGWLPHQPFKILEYPSKRKYTSTFAHIIAGMIGHCHCVKYKEVIYDEHAYHATSYTINFRTGQISGNGGYSRSNYRTLEDFYYIYPKKS